MENQDKEKINQGSKIPLTESFVFSKKNTLPTTITEIVESREQETPQILEILPNIKDFYISFINPYNTNKNNIDYTYNENDNDLIERNKKIKLRKKDLYKILKMMKLPKEEINPYILFSFTSIKSELVTNTIQAYKLDYDKLQKLINNYYIQLGKKDENIELKQKSLKKIFDLLDKSPNERLSHIQFYEVDDEEIEYEEEEEEVENEEINDMPSVNKKIIIKKKISSKDSNNTNYVYSTNYNYVIESEKRTTTLNKSNYKEDDDDMDSANEKENINNNYKIIKIQKENKTITKKQKSQNFEKDKKKEKPKKPKNKIKVKNIGGNNNTSDKLEPNSLDALKDIITTIPSILEKHKDKEKDKKPSKKILKSKKKPNNKYKVITQQTEVIEINTDKSIQKENDSEYYNISISNSFERSKTIEEKNIKKYNKPAVNAEPPTENYNNKYPFILSKTPEYDNCKMYLVGSIPKLGNWNYNSAIPMDEEIKNSQPFYTKYLDINKDEFPFEYKYLYNKDGKIIWLGKPKVNYKAYPQYFNLYQKIQENKNKLSIFDLNIRYINKVDGLNIWDNRKLQLVQLILKYLPDVLFFQEITRPQYEFLEEHLNSVYENVGVYRDNTDLSEKCSISYNKIKFTLTDWGQFWLSSTPYIPGSNDFGNFFPRICTWALLKRIDGEQCLFFNIHLDHVKFDAHLPCMKVVLNESEKILNNFSETKIVFLGGCFYCEEDDELISKLKEYGYREVIFENTFHDFTGEADRHWDYLFWKEVNHEIGDSKTELKTVFVPKKDSTIDFRNNQYISDHYPVIAEFQFEDKNIYTNSNINMNENINSDYIYDNPDEKKEFSEMDEDENNIRRSGEFEEYEDNDDNNDIKNNIKRNIENNDDEENEEVEVIEVEEEVEDNKDNEKKEEAIHIDKKENDNDNDNDNDNEEEEIEVEENKDDENDKINKKENEKEEDNELNEEIEEEIEQEEESEKGKKEEVENEEQEEIEEEEEGE